MADQVKFVFVITDPERDLPEVLRRWLDLFDRRFVDPAGAEQAMGEVRRQERDRQAATTQ
jgi:cytochrome oxidase Cu insertion factor (SCO1/SenC/PrrC family)